MSDHNINKVEINDDIQIKDLKIDDNTYVVLCSDKKDFYHMVPIINNTVYDKNDSSLNLYVLSLYK